MPIAPAQVGRHKARVDIEVLEQPLHELAGRVLEVAGEAHVNLLARENVVIGLQDATILAPGDVAGGFQTTRALQRRWRKQVMDLPVEASAINPPRSTAIP